MIIGLNVVHLKTVRNYLKYYDLERYLFEDVHRRFHAEGSLGAFDFFSIIVWKANRGKSMIAFKLLKTDKLRRRDLEAIARAITRELYKAKTPKEQFRVLSVGWRLPLPTASAILTVGWPDEFTVFDYRVRERINFQSLSYASSFDHLWRVYLEYQARAAAAAPAALNLRDKDRYLWGQSAALQLEEEIRRFFVKPTGARRKGRSRLVSTF